MAKEPNQPQPEAVTMTVEQILELVRTAVSSNALDAEAISKIAASAATESSKALRDQWWDERTYPGVSAFNPKGEKEHPRDALVGDIYWAGYLLRGDELVQEEIELINQLRPGDYEILGRDAAALPFVVRDLDPGSKTSRRLLVLFPCRDMDQRHNLPSMREMLRQVVAPAAVPA